MKKKIFWALGGTCALLLLAGLTGGRDLINYFFGEAGRPVIVAKGNIGVPHTRTLAWSACSAEGDSLCRQWADKPLRDEQLNGKGNVPRILLAKLLSGRDIPLVNATIMKMKAWGVTGSSWALNRKGDYDFTISVLTTLLWLYGDRPDLLYPATRDHLLKALLTEDGNHFRRYAPRTLGLVDETENHLLMTEGSRYLKNRWIMLHGDHAPYYDNTGNGMEAKMLALLRSLQEGGLYEFHSIPYAGYTIAALLNLEEFASDTVQREARDVLDYINWCYALGSYGLKHYPPMRRRYDKEGIKDLCTDYESVYMKAWLSYLPGADHDRDIHNGEVHFLTGVYMRYRPADAVVKMLFDKGKGYFVKLGHGRGACPEIYSAGRHFLLSAGGAGRGHRSLIVARPITLFLDDTASRLGDVIHLAGPGSDFMKWNNTGVYRNFACAAGPVSVPWAFTPVAVRGNWSVYAEKDSVSVAVYSTPDLGLVAVFERRGWEGLLEEIRRSNPDEGRLSDHFQFPGGEMIGYDVDASPEKWVIATEDGKELDRDFDGWPLMDGDIGREK